MSSQLTKLGLLGCHRRLGRLNRSHPAGPWPTIVWPALGIEIVLHSLTQRKGGELTARHD